MEPTTESASAADNTAAPGGAEALIQWLARGPAAAKRLLDLAAHTRGPLGFAVQTLSSVWLGLVWLALAGAYIAIGSGFAALRARLEMTELEFFNAWPLVTLMILLSLSVIVVTLRRIPLNICKIGVWLVHAGIIVLVAGCFLYFSGKIEGRTRIFLGQSVSHFYDATDRALYLTRMDASDHGPLRPAGPEIMIPLRRNLRLPIFHERLDLNPDGSAGRPLNIPLPDNAWADDPKLAPLHIRITGYYPYAMIEQHWAPGPPTDGQPNPAVELDTGHGSHWLLANVPANRFAEDDAVAIDYLYRPTPQRVAELMADFTGDRAIVVQVGNVVRTYAAQEATEIAVEGTPYRLVPGRPMTMPLVSDGYKGAFSPMLPIQITRQDPGGDTTFERWAVARFPERSPDFVGEGPSRKRVQDRIDHNIAIAFHDASKDQFWILEDDRGQFTLIHRHKGGKVDQRPLKIGEALTVNVGGNVKRGEEALLRVASRTPNAVTETTARWVAPKHRSRAAMAADVMVMGVAQLELTAGNWQKKRVAVPFIEYAAEGPQPQGRQPTLLYVPGVGHLRLLLSTVRRPLPSRVKLEQFDLVKYPGASNFIQDYISTLRLTDPLGASRVDQTRLNSPAVDHGLCLFQAFWDGNENALPAERFTILGVGNRPGVWTMTAGCILMVLGTLYAFYLKPILLRRRNDPLPANALSGGTA